MNNRSTTAVPAPALSADLTSVGLSTCYRLAAQLLSLACDQIFPEIILTPYSPCGHRYFANVEEKFFQKKNIKSVGPSIHPRYHHYHPNLSGRLLLYLELKTLPNSKRNKSTPNTRVCNSFFFTHARTFGPSIASTSKSLSVSACQWT